MSDNESRAVEAPPSKALAEACEAVGIRPKNCPAATVAELQVLLRKTQGIEAALELVHSAQKHMNGRAFREAMQALHEFAAQSYYARNNAIAAICVFKERSSRKRQKLTWRMDERRLWLKKERTWGVYHRMHYDAAATAAALIEQQREKSANR
jgi:hypothetical protein